MGPLLNAYLAFHPANLTFINDNINRHMARILPSEGLRSHGTGDGHHKSQNSLDLTTYFSEMPKFSSKKSKKLGFAGPAAGSAFTSGAAHLGTDRSQIRHDRVHFRP